MWLRSFTARHAVDLNLLVLPREGETRVRNSSSIRWGGISTRRPAGGAPLIYSQSSAVINPDRIGDVVLVHGLGGTPRGTWTSNRSSGSWPEGSGAATTGT
jgi:hypothetical protein